MSSFSAEHSTSTGPIQNRVTSSRVISSEAKKNGAARSNAPRRQEILDAATTVFAAKGIVAATVRDISDRCGIHSGSLYHHFKSKEEMIAEILVPVVSSLLETFDHIVAQTDDPIEILSRCIAAAVAQTAANPDVARMLQQNEQQIRDYPGLDEVVRQRRSMRERIERAIVNGISSGKFRRDIDPRVASMTLFDCVLGAYRHLKPIGDYNAEELTQQLIALNLQGLRRPE
jgi:TetR/AcrR family transcriptional regulator, cholesterol catabolism regulator